MLLGEFRQALTVAQLLVGEFEMCWGLVSDNERAGSALDELLLPCVGCCAIAGGPACVLPWGQWTRHVVA